MRKITLDVLDDGMVIVSGTWRDEYHQAGTDPAELQRSLERVARDSWYHAPECNTACAKALHHIG